MKNLSILSAILTHKLKSNYELSKLIDMDVSNLNKLIAFFEAVGALKIKTSTVAGRAAKPLACDFSEKIVSMLRALSSV